MSLYPVNYDFPLLTQTEQNVRTHVKHIISQVDELHGSVRQAQSVWESSSAAPAYADLMGSWETIKEQILHTLHKFGAAIGDAGRDMKATENANTRTLGG